MFQCCRELSYLDLSNFDISNANNISYMFYGCSKLKEIKGINKLIANQEKDMTKMFKDCKELIIKN